MRPLVLPLLAWSLLGCGGTPQPLEVRARNLSTEVAVSLELAGIPPNCDEAGRERARELFGIGESHIGTCGDLTSRLEEKWTARFGTERSTRIAVYKMRVGRGIALSLNADHAAWVLLHPNGPLVHDLWYHGKEHGNFAGFADSQWNGMAIDEWIVRMEADGYNAASSPCLTEETQRSPREVAQELTALALETGASE